MWVSVRDRLREWWILVIALCVIGTGAYLISSPTLVQSRTTATSEQTTPPPGGPQTASRDTSAAVPAAKQQPPAASAPPSPAQPSATRDPGATRAPSPAPAKTAQAPNQAPPASNQAAQVPNQAPPAGNQAPPSSSTATQQSTASTAGDVAAGRQVFRKCQACHSMDAGKNILGPSLAGIIGRKAGAEPGYSYSPAMKQANIVWDAKTLDAYLADPAKVIPGNKMPFPGLKTDHDRADVVAFMAASSGGAAQQAQAPQAQTPPPQQNPPASNPATPSAPDAPIGYLPDARYTLRSGIAEGRMVYIGVGGAIEGKINPVLTASEGQVVQLT